MSSYESRKQRAALEQEFDELPPVEDGAGGGDVSTVVSVRLRHGELAAVERAAAAAKLPLSTFIRQAAVNAAGFVDVRALSARAEAIENEARELLALLRGTAA